MTYALYIMASKPYGTLYIGVTNSLQRRIWEHKQGIGCTFTAKHNIKTFVWFEMFDNIETAIAQEKRMKKWKRDWKINLIERNNPHWQDLFDSIGHS
ncbi:GIY-YIG nuclease family protein [Hirschia baltica]|uniref:Excinuclease ABC C subunit domain protein n=1 Tax=Hirschia baltica (strain ATCC 49814 / DSM 5838 / IFAM 1418) TaxID=582402 RepID=C6XIV9_HIRBI|nr:GIY-YIG nuclease family protein [Hirschia baltica]ACT59054.1 Excinuclease ABC C subunit domain protein [Hirschia baltica ATCC 49814]